MNIFKEPLVIDRTEQNIFSYTDEDEKIMAEKYQEFDRKQIIAEHQAIDAARALILTD